MSEKLKRENVLVTSGAPNLVNPDYLAEQAEIIDRAFKKMPLNRRQEVDKAVIK